MGCFVRAEVSEPSPALEGCEQEDTLRAPDRTEEGAGGDPGKIPQTKTCPGTQA